MRAPILPAVGFYTDANRHWSTQDCLNWLPVRAERPGTRTQYQLRQCPGMKPFVRTTETGVGRGIYNVEGKLLSVVGSNLYQISNTGVAIPRGTIPGVRRVSMAHNQHGSSNQVSIANGSAGYIYDTSATTLTKITDDGFPGAMLTFFVDGYLGYIDPQGIYWGHSDLNDGLSYNALDSYEAEGLPDRIISGLVSHREVLIFGTDSTEPYVNSPSGDGTAPFQRASNTVIETGCAATFSPVKLGDLVVFLDQYRRVCVLNGYTAVPISTAAIDQAFGECTEAEVKQAWAFGWQDRGHIVYYITVPGRFTFGYDFTHKEWHRRATNGLPHWAVSGVVKWNGKVIAQDSRNGDLYELRWEYARDTNNSELIREYSPGSLNAGRNHICVNRVSLEFGVRESEEAVDFPPPPPITGFIAYDLYSNRPYPSEEDTFGWIAYEGETVGAPLNPSIQFPNNAQYWDIAQADDGNTLAISNWATSSTFFRIYRYESGGGVDDYNAFSDVTGIPASPSSSILLKGIAIAKQSAANYVIAMAAGGAGATGDVAYAYDWDGGTSFAQRTITGIPSIATASGRGGVDVAVSQDGTYLAVFHNTTSDTEAYLRLYKRQPDNSYLQVNTNPVVGFSTGAVLEFSPGASHLAFLTAAGSDSLIVYKIVGDDLVQIFSDDGADFPDGHPVAYSQNGNWLSVGSGSFPGTLRVYGISGDTYSLSSANALSDIPGLQVVYDAKYFHGGTKLIAAVQVASYTDKTIHVYNVSADGSLSPDPEFSGIPSDTFLTYSFACAASPLSD